MKEKLVVTTYGKTHTLELRPFTILMGRQGAGKSLISKAAYFLRNMSSARSVKGAMFPEGVTQARLETALQDETGDTYHLIKAIHSAVVSADGGVTTRVMQMVETENSNALPSSAIVSFGYSPVVEWGIGQTETGNSNALYIPSGRSVFSYPRIAATHPDPYIHEAWQWIEKAAKICSANHKSNDSLVDEAWKALGGRAYYAGEDRTWRWKSMTGQTTKRKSVKVSQASDGQREIWPLVVIADYLLGLPAEQGPLYVHIEHPEAYLHPAVQVWIVRLLTRLVMSGFRVLITTHSLTVIYALSNLLLAGLVAERTGKPATAFPGGVYLPSGSVAAYWVNGLANADGEDSILDLFDEEEGLFSEVKLGDTNGQLENEMHDLKYILYQEGKENEV